MKKAFLTILCGLGLSWAAPAFAQSPQPGEVSREVRRADNFNSDAVYQSSLTCAGSALQSVWVSSPLAAALFSIKVTSPGTGGSYFEVWDGGSSTGNARKVDGPINTMVKGQEFYSVAFSSWLGVSNQTGPSGGIPACIDIIYRVR